jgi:hypothetical protein
MASLNGGEIVNQTLLKQFLVGSCISADASRFLSACRQGGKDTQQEN